jgi:hypothetical protein
MSGAPKAGEKSNRHCEERSDEAIRKDRITVGKVLGCADWVT